MERMTSETREKARAVLKGLGYDPSWYEGGNDDDLIECMDDAVHDLKSKEASGINNGGPEEQLEYLKDWVRKR